MSISDQHAYLTKRAREERNIAICCEDNAIALTHFRFAEEYDRRAAALADGTESDGSQPEPWKPFAPKPQI